MPEGWPYVPLGSFTRHRTEPIFIDDRTRYKRCRVQLHARGIVLRDSVDGVAIETKKQWVACTNDFLVAEIDAKVGGYGIVPPELDGAIVSSHYFLFEPDLEKVTPDWMGLYCKTPEFFDQVAARGSTNYSAIRPKAVQAFKFPLPSLEEQMRIVAKVQEAMSALDRAAALHAQTAADFDRLLIALAHRDDLAEEEKRERGWRKLRLGDVMRLDLHPVKVDPGKDYPNLGIFSFAKGAFGKPALSGLSLRAETLFRVRAGQFAYLKLNGYEGAFARVPEELDGFFVTNEFPTFSALPDQARSEWIACHFMKPSVWASLAHKSKGTPTRRQRVNPPAILAHEAWVPPRPEQDRIAEILAAQRDFVKNDTFQRDADSLRRSILSVAFRGEL